MTTFALSAGLDADRLAEIYGRSSRLQIGNFLEAGCAQALFSELAHSKAWRLAVNRGDQILDYSPEAYAALSPEQRAKLGKAIALGGRYGFQFCYDTIRLPKDDTPIGGDTTLLARFADFLSSSAIIAFMRTLTGADDIGFADAHASRYRPGHFLTAHDDAMEDMGRRAAYVLNLSPEWRPDWGGLLLFHDARGNIVRGFTPAFNTLTIFRVPQAHSVSWVTPLAGQMRYAVTGWLRAGERGGA